MSWKNSLNHRTMYNDTIGFGRLSSDTHTCPGGTTVSAGSFTLSGGYNRLGSSGSIAFSGGTFALGANYHTTSAAAAPLTSDETHILRDGVRVRCVALTDIAAVVAEGHYTRVFLATEPAMFILRGVKAWATQLPAQKFMRVGRSLIINLARVRSIEAHSRDESRLTLAAVGTPLILRRAASARLRTALSAERCAPMAVRA